MMLKRKIKGIFITLKVELVSSEYVSLLCNEDIKKVEKIMLQLEKEGFLK